MAAQADIRKWFLKKPEHSKSAKDPAADLQSPTAKSQFDEGGNGTADKGSRAVYRKESKFFSGSSGGGGSLKGTSASANSEKLKLKLDRKDPEAGKRKGGEVVEDFNVNQKKPSPKKPRLVIPADDDVGCQKIEGRVAAGAIGRNSADTTPEKNKRQKTPSKSQGSQQQAKDAQETTGKKTPARGRGRGKSTGSLASDQTSSEEEEGKQASFKSPPSSRGKSSNKETKTPSRGMGIGATAGGEDDNTKTAPGSGRGRGRGRGGGGGGGLPPWMQSRGVPPHKGEKVVPQGAEDVLAGLAFVISGTLDSLEREEAEFLIKSHGGRVLSSVSKKTDYLLADEDLGGAKSKKAKELGIKFLSEDELFAMIIASKPKAESGQKIKTNPPAKASPLKIPSQLTGAEVSNGGKSVVPVTEAGNSIGKSPMKKDVLARSVPALPAGKATQDSESWPNKHRPKSSADIVGNPGIVKQLKDWLQRWDATFLHPVSKSVKGAKRGGAGGPSGEKKAVLLSGTPGIGKTTTARLICKELGFETLEVNASDSRGKADSKIRTGMGGSTANTIKEMVNNESISFSHQKDKSRKSVLIMDEVDGMSGGDRGGVADLIASIKSSRVPIICICNDKYSQKLKSLQNYCLPLAYRKLTKQQMGKRLMQVAKAEGIQVDEVTLEDIADRTNGDMRMALNQLEYMSLRTRTLKFVDVHSRLLASSKDEDISGFSAADKLLGSDGGRLRMDERVDLHMSDMDLVPLLIQENYLNYVPSSASQDQSGVALMNLAALAAKSIADGDIVNVQIRRRQQWQHSQTGAFLSSIIPSALMHGRRIEYEGGRNFNRFPGWLGKNSTYGKKVRLLEDVHIHLLASRICEPTREAIRLEYVPLFALNFSYPLHHMPKETAVEQIVGLMDEYSLNQEDYETIMDISKFKGQPDLLEGVAAPVKAALTKFYKQKEQNRCIRSADLLPALVLPGSRKTAKKPAQLKLAVEDPTSDELEDDAEADGDQEEEEDTEEIVKLDSLLNSNETTKVTVDYEKQKGMNGQRGRGSKLKGLELKTPRKSGGDAKAGSSSGKRKR